MLPLLSTLTCVYTHPSPSLMTHGLKRKCTQMQEGEREKRPVEAVSGAELKGPPHGASKGGVTGRPKVPQTINQESSFLLQRSLYTSPLCI